MALRLYSLVVSLAVLHVASLGPCADEVTRDQARGTVTSTTGPALASSTSVDVVINGKGGAWPRLTTTVDPIVLASGMIPKCGHAAVRFARFAV